MKYFLVLICLGSANYLHGSQADEEKKGAFQKYKNPKEKDEVRQIRPNFPRDKEDLRKRLLKYRFNQGLRNHDWHASDGKQV